MTSTRRSTTDHPLKRWCQDSMIPRAMTLSSSLSVPNPAEGCGVAYYIKYVSTTIHQQIYWGWFTAAGRKKNALLHQSWLYHISSIEGVKCVGIQDATQLPQIKRRRIAVVNQSSWDATTTQDVLGRQWGAANAASLPNHAYVHALAWRKTTVIVTHHVYLKMWSSLPLHTATALWCAALPTSCRDVASRLSDFILQIRLVIQCGKRSFPVIIFSSLLVRHVRDLPW